MAAVLLVYARSLPYPFEFDDIGSIVGNGSLRNFWSFRWLVPPGTMGETVSGRPLLNMTFAINHAWGGLDPVGYRAGNVLLHILAALTILGVVSRTQRRLQSRTGAQDAAPRAGHSWMAVGLVLLWAIHPLQTSAVTYIVQRAEVMAALFYGLTVYCFVRGTEPTGAGGNRGLRSYATLWLTLSVAACWAGAATKETIVTAPVLVLLFDRAIVTGTFAAAWRARRTFYLALCTSWIPLAILVAVNPDRGGSAGFGSAIDVPTYLLTQLRALPHYLSVVVWPRGMVFDHGVETVSSLRAVLPQLVLLLLAGASTWVLLCRNRLTGLLAAGFFLILAPSSSFVPVSTQTVAEHRMYLPLALVLLLAGLSLAAAERALLSRPVPNWGRAGLLVTAALLLGSAAFARNNVYRSALALWQDTAIKRPANARAHHNLGLELVRAGRPEEAAGEFRRAIGIQPNHAFAHAWLAVVLLDQGRSREAADHLRTAVDLDSHYAFGWLRLGDALAEMDRAEEAEQAYRTAITLNPEDPDAHAGLGQVLAAARRLDEAAVAFGRVLELVPDRVDARANLGNCLLLLGRVREAIACYEAVLSRQPENDAARRNLELARQLISRE